MKRSEGKIKQIRFFLIAILLFAIQTPLLANPADSYSQLNYSFPSAGVGGCPEGPPCPDVGGTNAEADEENTAEEYDESTAEESNESTGTAGEYKKYDQKNFDFGAGCPEGRPCPNDFGGGCPEGPPCPDVDRIDGNQ